MRSRLFSDETNANRGVLCCGPEWFELMGVFLDFVFLDLRPAAGPRRCAFACF